MQWLARKSVRVRQYRTLAACVLPNPPLDHFDTFGDSDLVGFRDFGNSGCMDFRLLGFRDFGFGFQDFGFGFRVWFFLS